MNRYVLPLRVLFVPPSEVLYEIRNTVTSRLVPDLPSVSHPVRLDVLGRLSGSYILDHKPPWVVDALRQAGLFRSPQVSSRRLYKKTRSALKNKSCLETPLLRGEYLSDNGLAITHFRPSCLYPAAFLYQLAMGTIHRCSHGRFMIAFAKEGADMFALDLSDPRVLRVAIRFRSGQRRTWMGW